MGLGRLTLGLEPGPSGGQDRPVGGEGRTMTVQMRSGQTLYPLSWASKEEASGKGKAGWDEVLFETLGG